MSFQAYPSQKEEYNSLIRNPFGVRQKQVKLIEAPSPPLPQNLTIPLTVKKEKKWKAPLKLKTFSRSPHSVHWGINPLKKTSPVFFTETLIKPENCPRPLF